MSENRRDRTGKSWDFDRAVEIYDRTRSLSPEAMEGMLATLEEELEGADRVLEVGAGTGRLSIPLAERGFRVFGVDLSGPMLRRLIQKAGDGPRPEVLVGDATRLPLRSDAFDGALLFHVLHLVPDWPQVLRELDRVVRSGGAIVIGLGSVDGTTDPIPGEVGAAFQRATGIQRQFPGLLHTEAGRFDAVVGELGWVAHATPQITDVQSRSLESLIAEFEDGVWSWTWDLTEEQRHEAADTTRNEIRERYGDLDAQRSFESHIGVRPYRKAGDV
ncbi:MAG: methyltransferase domain-containing protein [Actinomycetota bacterium]